MSLQRLALSAEPPAGGAAGLVCCVGQAGLWARYWIEVPALVIAGFAAGSRLSAEELTVAEPTGRAAAEKRREEARSCFCGLGVRLASALVSVRSEVLDLIADRLERV